jgi:putative transposase
MIIRDHRELSISRQCELLGIHRSGLYYRPCAESEENAALMRRLDEQYFKTPFYGVRRLRMLLVGEGYRVNLKRVARLMGLIGWRTLYRGRRTTIRSKTHPVYPYLLKDLAINRINQVWAMDITYIPMRRGFLYLTAIIDVASRYVVGWSISNTMSAEWCTQVMREAIETHGKPEIVNTDQGSQFTSEEFTSLLKDQGVRISMDSKGRAIYNIFIKLF